MSDSDNKISLTAGEDFHFDEIVRKISVFAANNADGPGGRIADAGLQAGLGWLLRGNAVKLLRPHVVVEEE